MSASDEVPIGLARGRGVFAAGGESELVPQTRLSGPMPWVIAIMVAMTVIALAAGLALRNMAAAAAAELEGGLTVQVLEPRGDIRQRETGAVTATLSAMPDILSVRVVPREEVDALIEPWLGSGSGSGRGHGTESSIDAAVPVPTLVDVQTTRRITPERLEQIRADVTRAAPSARVDAQSNWLEPVFDALDSLQWLAAALVALLGVALAAAVLLAARSALGANRDTIEIVHLLGGTDRQIARVFQRSIGVDAAGGGVVGLALAVVVILFLARRFGGLGAGLVDHGALGWADWVLLALVPVAAAVLAMVTARLTVMHALRRML